MKHNFAVDVGIASVGYSVIDAVNKEVKIAGVRIFDVAEDPKTGASLAEPRRTARGIRRVIRRRAKRKKDIKNLLAENDLSFLPNIEVYKLRADALKRKLNDEEFASVLFHIAKRRGVKYGHRDKSKSDEENKKLTKAKEGSAELRKKMQESGKETIGAYLSSLDKKRNGDGDYSKLIERNLIESELNIIFDKQSKFGNAKATNEFLEKFIDIAFFQRPLQSSINLVGECTFEEGEKRAPKFSYSTELFVLWLKLNNTVIRSQDGKERVLTADEKRRLVDKAHSLKKITYAQARKELSLSDDERFNIGYRKIKAEDDSWEKIRDTAEKADFLKLTGYHTLKDILGRESAMSWQEWLNKPEILDEIARIISFYEDEREMTQLFEKAGVPEKYIPELLRVTNFSKTVDLSLKAISKILPHLQNGLRYDEACKKAGFHHSKKERKTLNKIPPFYDVRNPVVNRAMAQTRKILNALIREYGMPENIIIELARDVGKPFEDRKKIEKENKKNEGKRTEARNQAAEVLGTLSDNIRSEEILKHRLWKEQHGFCPYSGEYITPEKLRDSTATQIDHIIPYSRSWDNSYMNKVLCMTDENQNKQGRTPFEYIGGNQARWDALEAFARKLPKSKADRLLMKEYGAEQEKKWKDRALNDTRYMARLLKEHLELNLNLGEGNRVQTRNGALTANLRRSWGFPDKTRDNDRHHALDAIVLACSTQSMVQKFSSWNKLEARKKNPNERPLPPLPWKSFREDAITAVDKIFVSRMPVRKVTGAAHEETVRSIREDAEGKKQIVQRLKLASLNLKKLEDMVDKERNINLYNVLKERLEANGDDPKKAFTTPVYLPSKEGKTAPQIKGINIITNEKSGIEINNGLVSNGSQVRVDVFRKDEKFFLVPIYVHHFAQKQLPSKAIIANKSESEWEEMNDDDFIFSLYKNDLVRVKSKNEDFKAYYTGTTDISTGAICLKWHDNDPNFGKDGLKRIGVKTLLEFEKYNVDLLGNISKHPVKKEVRCGVACGDGSKSSKNIAGAQATSD